jgi:hypothetical protein
MSAIDPTKPADADNLASAPTYGSAGMRNERVWLNDLMTAYLVRHQAPLVTGDPGTCTGLLKAPFSAPGSPLVGDFYFTTTGLVYGFKAGPVAQLMGTLSTGDKKIFRQSAAPTGWTRDTSLTDGTTLRYLASGNPSAGGTVDISAALAHSPSTVFFNHSAINFSAFISVNDHSILKYLDVILATKN